MVNTLPGRLAIAMMVLAGSAASQPVSVEIAPESVVNRSFRALRDGRPTDIEWRSLRLRTTSRFLYELVLLRDPVAGEVLWFVWTIQDSITPGSMDNPAGGLEPNKAVRIDQGVMRSFIHVGGLIILESSARADNLDAAQKIALADFQAHGNPGEQAGRRLWAPAAHWIRLDNLPKSLMRQPPGWLPPHTTLHAQARSGRCWSLTLESATESARLLVDAAYDLATAEECAKPAGRGTHVSLVRSDPPAAMSALRNNKPATIEFHSALAQVIYPDGGTGQVHLLMLYDPHTGLFWWRQWPVYRNQPNPTDAQVEKENQRFRSFYSVFLTDDRMGLFSSRTVSDSTVRYPDFGAAQAAALSGMEAARGDMEQGGGSPQRMLHYTGIPENYFMPGCPMDIGPVIELKHVARVDGVWKLTLVGTNFSNGNSAVLSLKDSYEPAGVELLANEASPLVGEVRSIAATRNGLPVTVEIRELTFRSTLVCGQMPVKAALIFDPSTHLSAWTSVVPWQSPFSPTVVVTSDKLVLFSAGASSLDIIESGERHTSWGEFQSQVVERERQRRPESSYHSVDLGKRLPRYIVHGWPSPAPQVSQTDTGWRVVMAGAGSVTAVLELDRLFNCVRAEVRDQALP